MWGGGEWAGEGGGVQTCVARSPRAKRRRRGWGTRRLCCWCSSVGAPHHPPAPQAPQVQQHAAARGGSSDVPQAPTLAAARASHCPTNTRPAPRMVRQRSAAATASNCSRHPCAPLPPPTRPTCGVGAQHQRQAHHQRCQGGARHCGAPTAWGGVQPATSSGGRGCSVVAWRCWQEPPSACSAVGGRRLSFMAMAGCGRRHVRAATGARAAAISRHGRQPPAMRGPAPAPPPPHPLLQLSGAWEGQVAPSRLSRLE